jgi:hypothetical protein
LGLEALYFGVTNRQHLGWHDQSLARKALVSALRTSGHEERQLDEQGRSLGRAMGIFGAALKLGLTSFGGPIAHLGYFERAYVQQRRWLSASDFAGIVGLCQLLPGPASSQVGFLIGYRRAGWSGA